VQRNHAEFLMPTLFRFLFVLAVIAGIIYGSMVALVFLVEPRERDVTVRVPSERLNPPAQKP
jgi:SNF family Na+-dependent transporter